MSKKVAIIISPNWKDYAEKYLVECLDSIKHQDFTGESKIFLIDNETSESSYNFLKNIAFNADIIRNKKNDGFAKGNNEAMKIALEQGYDYLVLINMDTVSDFKCISELVKQAEKYKSAGIIQARLMLRSDKNKINSIGNTTHFLGFGYSDGYRDEYKPVGYKEISYASGAGFLIKADVLKKIGLFDEEMWMYNEDQDLGWRAWLAGYKCILAPDAIIYHKYSFSKSIKNYYWMDRNRIINILKHYKIMTLVLIAPAFFVMEIGLLLFAIIGGWFKEKIKVYDYFFKKETWDYIKKSRKESQALRKVLDKEIIKLFSANIIYQEIDSIFLRIGNICFDFYWKLVKLLIIW